LIPIPLNIAGNDIIIMVKLVDAINVPSVVLDRAIHLYSTIIANFYFKQLKNVCFNFYE
jgi:hypothetical protein